MKKIIRVDYTEKDYKGMKSERFNSKDDAKAWIKENEATIYWSSIRVENAKSDKPKIVVEDTAEIKEYIKGEFIKVEGTLQTYFETGMECMGLIIQDSTKQGPPNPNFDPNKPEGGSNFRFYSSYDGLHFIGDGDILQVEGESKYLLVKDRDFAADDGYRLSFYPQGFSREELVSLFQPETVKATLWKMKK